MALVLRHVTTLKNGYPFVEPDAQPYTEADVVRLILEFSSKPGYQGFYHHQSGFFVFQFKAPHKNHYFLVEETEARKA